MVWKDWPYWLRGAVLADGVFITLLLFAFFIIDRIFLTGGHPSIGLSFLIALPGYIPLQFIAIHFLGSVNNLTALFIIILVSLIFYFLIGALIGWTVGKFKSKNVR